MTRILALETSSDRGSVALCDATRIVLERELPAGKRSAQSLIPTLNSLLHDAQWDFKDVQLIALTIGPGSFTGLRVGVTTAKTLAYVHSVPLAPINTLDVIAAQSRPQHARHCCIMDAQRHQLFVAHYGPSVDGLPQRISPIEIIDIDTWLESLEADTYVNGPALAKLQGRLPTDIDRASTEHWVPRATVVAQLGQAAALRGETQDHWSLVPEYYRASAAEEKLQ